MSFLGTQETTNICCFCEFIASYSGCCWCAGRRADGSHLPDCFKLKLTDFLPKQLSPAALAKAAQKEPKGKAKGRAAEAKGKVVKAKGGGRKRASDEHK